jgi:hypothetical protein
MPDGPAPSRSMTWPNALGIVFISLIALVSMPYFVLLVVVPLSGGDGTWETDRLEGGMRQADGHLPAGPPQVHPLDEVRVRPRHKRLPPVHLRTLNEEQMDYYRLLYSRVPSSRLLSGGP